MAIFKSNRNKRRSKFIPFANQVIGSTGKVAVKGVEKSAKWLLSDHAKIVESTVIGSSFMESLQNINFLLAQIALTDRRQNRQGTKVNILYFIMWWIIDHLWFLWDVWWGFIQPMLTFFLWSLIHLLIVIFFNLLFLFFLYVLLSNNKYH
jgi:hypothetical protein